MEHDESVPEIIVLNPADAELFDLTNATSAGLHAVMDNDSTGTGALAGGPSRTAWGLTQVHSTAITAGHRPADRPDGRSPCSTASSRPRT